MGGRGGSDTGCEGRIPSTHDTVAHPAHPGLIGTPCLRCQAGAAPGGPVRRSRQTGMSSSRGAPSGRGRERVRVALAPKPCGQTAPSLPGGASLRWGKTHEGKPTPLRTRFLGRLEILPGGPVGASKSLQRAAALASTPRREGETAPHALARGEPPCVALRPSCPWPLARSRKAVCLPGRALPFERPTFHHPDHTMPRALHVNCVHVRGH